MFIPNDFEIVDDEEIYRFIDKNSFGQLISTVEGRLFATHLPLLMSKDKQKILGHFAKKNPQHTEISNHEALIVLQGPHDYISPSWYSSPGVPTWNYQAIHIYGSCRTFTECEELKTIVDSLTEKYEADFDKPWQPTYKASMLNAIVGVEMTIKDIQCKYKLSQNRSKQDQENVVEQLEKRGSNTLAKAMLDNKIS